jgi:hypothetical protein
MVRQLMSASCTSKGPPESPGHATPPLPTEMMPSIAQSGHCEELKAAMVFAR